jgi:SP family sugar:H+ symporter-like MFS transporter
MEQCTLTALQQSLISVTILFIGVGSTVAGIAGKYLGRRGTIRAGALCIAVGAGSMLGTSGNFAAYMACKCIQCIGLGFAYAAFPTWGVECIAASKRGMLMASLNVGLGLGYMLAAGICWGTSIKTTNIAWQAPIICQLPLALILAGGTFVFPESPHWLLLNKKVEAATKSLSSYYMLPSNSPDILWKVNSLQHYIELERENEKTTNWTEIFRGLNLRRTLRSFLLVVAVAETGSRFLATYSTIFFAGLVITNPYKINMIAGACSLGGTLFSPFALEYLGRRVTLLTGYGSLAICMLIIAAVGSGLGSHNPSAQTTLVVFICLWNALYAAFLGVSVPIIAPEMHSMRLRTYGYAATITVFEVFAFQASFATPYMINPLYGNMGLNVGYFFFGKP